MWRKTWETDTFQLDAEWPEGGEVEITVTVRNTLSGTDAEALEEALADALRGEFFGSPEGES